MKLTIQEVIAIVGVLTAFLTALVSLIGLRWNKQALEARDAQLDSLKQQLEPCVIGHLRSCKNKWSP
jgi:hypothetical protein